MLIMVSGIGIEVMGIIIHHTIVVDMLLFGMNNLHSKQCLKEEFCNGILRKKKHSSRTFLFRMASSAPSVKACKLCRFLQRSYSPSNSSLTVKKRGCKLTRPCCKTGNDPPCRFCKVSISNDCTRICY